MFSGVDDRVHGDVRKRINGIMMKNGEKERTGEEVSTRGAAAAVALVRPSTSLVKDFVRPCRVACC